MEEALGRDHVAELRWVGPKRSRVDDDDNTPSVSGRGVKVGRVSSTNEADDRPTRSGWSWSSWSLCRRT